MAPAEAVILCGATERIGEGVIEMMKPEYEVIHFVLTTEAGCQQIPAILRGETPSSDSALGTKDYSKQPICVVLGGGYEDEHADKMMKAAAGTRDIPWLRCDTTKPAPPLGPEYGKALVARIKELLPQLKADGKMNEAKVQWY